MKKITKAKAVAEEGIKIVGSGYAIACVYNLQDDIRRQSTSGQFIETSRCEGQKETKIVVYCICR